MATQPPNIGQMVDASAASPLANVIGSPGRYNRKCRFAAEEPAGAREARHGRGANPT